MHTEGDKRISVDNLQDYTQEDFTRCGPMPDASYSKRAWLILDRAGKAFVRIKDVSSELENSYIVAGLNTALPIPDNVDYEALGEFLGNNGALYLGRIQSGREIIWDGTKFRSNYDRQATNALTDLWNGLRALPESGVTVTTLAEYLEGFSLEDIEGNLDEWLPGWRTGDCNYAEAVELVDYHGQADSVLFINIEHGLRQLVEMLRRA